MPGPLPRRSALNLISLENRQLGNEGWHLSGAATVSGYLGRASVAPGDTLELRATGLDPVHVEWWRLGWYCGAGGRLVRSDPEVTVRAKPPLQAADPGTGLIEAGWPIVLRVPVDDGWPSGSYVAVLRRSAGRGSYVPFIVREPTGDRVAPGAVRQRGGNVAGI
jgi:hypothetical protein